MTSKQTHTTLSLVVVGLLVFVVLIISHSRSQLPPVQPINSTMPASTPKIYNVDDRVWEYGEAVRGRLEPYFHRAGVPYPPPSLTLIGLKDEKTLLVYAGDQHGTIHFIRSYPILAASGHAGPKLREGDLQVPEGLYNITGIRLMV